MIYDDLDTAFTAATASADPEAAYKRAPLWEINHNDSPAQKNVFFALPMQSGQDTVKTGQRQRVIANVMFMHVHLLTDDQAKRDPKLRIMYDVMMDFYNALTEVDGSPITSKKIRFED